MVLLLAACGLGTPAGAPSVRSTATPVPLASDTSLGRSAGPDDAHPIRLAFIGDVMLGRGVADVAANDPGSIFENLRPVLADADLALANLETPLTARPHATGGPALEADTAVASLLASAGLDVVDLANDHATDAGPATVLDTIAATRAAGLASVGAGADEAAAGEPLVLDVGGVRLGILAFDMTGGTAAGVASPGVNAWQPLAAKEAVTALRAGVDLLIVAVHGGVEYLPRPDPVLEQAVDDLAAWGVDVVWGHGAHVRDPVTVAVGPRPAVLTAGLGSTVSDQQVLGSSEGAALEVMADRGGVLAMRIGTVEVDAGRATFTGWRDPRGDAVALDGEWWTPVRPPAAAPAGDCGEFDLGRVVAGLQAGSRVVATSCGAVTGTSATEMAVAYRHPLTSKLLQGIYPGRRWADAEGRSAHLAIMTPGARMVWGAGTLPDPIGAVVVCSGSLAVGYTTLDDPALVAAGAWSWRGFGFATAPPLSHPTAIGCADVDHDSATEPYIRRPTESLGGTAP